MPTTKIPLSEEAYNKIKGLLISLHFRPGEVLFTQQLANELNISRTPTREALVKLAQEGFLVQTDSRKFQVAYITESSIRDLYNLRKCFEVNAIEQVRSEITRKDIQAVEKINQNMLAALEAGDVDRFFQLDGEFHFYFIRKCGNQLMITFTNQLMDQQQRIRYITRYINHRMEKTVPEHAQIIDALKEGRTELAYEAIKSHLTQTQEETIDFLNSQEFSFVTQMQTIRIR